MEPDQLHALSVHKLKRRQDLTQHHPAGAEGLQNLSKARTACNGHGERTSRLARGHGASPQATQAALQAAKPTRPANSHLEVRKHTARNWPVAKQLGCVSMIPQAPKATQGTCPGPQLSEAPQPPGLTARRPRQGADVDVWAGRAGPEELGGHRGVLSPSGQGLGGTEEPRGGQGRGSGLGPTLWGQGAAGGSL